MTTAQERFRMIRVKVKEHLGQGLENYGETVNELFGIDKDTAKEVVECFVSAILCEGKIMLKKDIEENGFGEYKRD